MLLKKNKNQYTFLTQYKASIDLYYAVTILVMFPVSIIKVYTGMNRKFEERRSLKCMP